MNVALNDIDKFIISQRREVGLFAGRKAYESLTKRLSGYIELAQTDAGEAKRVLNELEEIKRSGRAQRKKLYGFCLDYEQTREKPGLPTAEGVMRVKVYSEAEFSGWGDIDSGDLDKFIEEMRAKKTYKDLIRGFMDREGEEKNSAIYKRAGLSRQDFSKIMSPKTKDCKREKLFNLSFGLRLSYEETKKLLRSAGHSFNKSKTGDLIIIYCILNGIYDLDKVNEILYSKGQKPLKISYEPPVNDKFVK